MTNSQEARRSASRISTLIRSGNLNGPSKLIFVISACRRKTSSHAYISPMSLSIARRTTAAAPGGPPEGISATMGGTMARSFGRCPQWVESGHAHDKLPYAWPIPIA